MSIVVYISLYYVLNYFVGSFWRYNIHAKVFQWLMTIYSIVTTLTGFQFSNLLPYLLQVVPTWAARPGDQGAACLRLSGVKNPQAEANNDGSNDETSQTKGIITPKGGVIKAPN
ncbi:hypothetical protein DSO57_1027185 [Entomophthora muscae]|uniref:Uncharacterized protein n=1 Tax=Entomophthora muscae TaxID=34485 RepID=A0ACC2TZQ8_9FUNG|nr:hypothetical protein DSO57_1027185 [Entomophthora muscae]